MNYIIGKRYVLDAIAPHDTNQTHIGDVVMFTDNYGNYYNFTKNESSGFITNGEFPKYHELPSDEQIELQNRMDKLNRAEKMLMKTCPDLSPHFAGDASAQIQQERLIREIVETMVDFHDAEIEKRKPKRHAL